MNITQSVIAQGANLEVIILNAQEIKQQQRQKM